MSDNVQQSPLTPSQREVVDRIKDTLGVLIVRDRTTYEKSKARPYGEEFTPVVPNMLGIERPDFTRKRKRVLEIHFRDSKVFPGGVPIGCTYEYRVTQAEGMGPDRAFRFVGAKYDIIQDEMKRVRALAYNRKWMSQQEREEDARRKAEMRQRAQEQSWTPSEAVGKSIADSIASAIATATKAAPVATEDAPKPKRKYVRRAKPSAPETPEESEE